MDCKEQDYSLIVEIKAYPEDAVTFSHPMQYENKHVNSSYYSVDENRVVLVPLKKLTAKLSESIKHERFGKTYTVTLDWEVDIDNSEKYEQLHFLENNVNHFEVRTFGERLSLIRAQNPGYRFTMEEDAGVIKCSLSVINKAGIQRVL